MNPFEKRATEYIRDPVAFLPYVTSEPLVVYLEKHAREDKLLDRLVVLIGSPGSGKTTLARLFEFPTLSALIRNKALASQSPLMDALVKCRAIGDGQQPAVCGCRLPMESDYRDCWELPYDRETRNRLLFSLLQARAVLAWLRGFEEVGIALDQVRLIPRADATAALEAIGGPELANIREVARQVEREVYGVTANLLPPPRDQLPASITAAYRPFDVFEFFEVPGDTGPLRLKPLLICDDAHVLHPDQVDDLIRGLSLREVRIARWVLMRIDALRPHEVLRPDGDAAEGVPGFSRGRDMVAIWMQSEGGRSANRRAFRKIARDMSDRYLQQMPVFARNNLTSLADMLNENVKAVSEARVKSLEASLRSGRRAGISPTRRAEIESHVDNYLLHGEERSKGATPPELRLMMVRILLERYLRRVPQASLFEGTINAEPSMALKADSTVRNAAEMQLFQEFGRAFFYSFDTLCDAATENAEKFLRLAGHLVAQIETQIIRKRPSTLSPEEQNKLLRERARDLLNEEDLPERSRVMRLCQTIADDCLKQTQGELNAPLGEGANAWGVSQADFDRIPESHPGLARALQSGVAYNMFTLVRDYKNQGEQWCLIELTGIWSLKEGLSLKRGSFLERSVSDLESAIGGNP